MRILVTGSSGFIGFHLCKLLLAQGHEVFGYDAMSDYYDVTLKEARLALLKSNSGFQQVNGLLEDLPLLKSAFEQARPEVVINLAAQAGVRYSIENPRTYLESNIDGFFNVLELSNEYSVKHLLTASTSSVYGANTKMPYQETDKTDTQMSFYAATKKANEVMAHSWAHIHGLPITAFRFFTVYGPWGRPDMAIFKFTKSILAGTEIDVYNNGEMYRDFTYVDDIVSGIASLIDREPVADSKYGESDSVSPVAPFRVVNIGNSNKVQLMDFISAIEDATGIQAKKNFLPMQQGDVPATWADATLLKELAGVGPATPIDVGVKCFVAWYKDYFGNSQE